MICLVCLIAAGKSDEIVATTCGHCYHKHCIEKWLEKSMFCPSCLRPSTVSSLSKLFIEFSDDNNLEDIDVLSEQIFLREKEISELKMCLENSETQVRTLKRKLIKADSTIEKLKHELQTERNLSSMCQTKLNDLKLKQRTINESASRIKRNLQPPNQSYPSQLPNPPFSQPPNYCQPPNADQSISAYQSLHPYQHHANQYQPSSFYQPSNVYQLPSAHQSSESNQTSNYTQPSSSFQLLNAYQQSNTYQSSISIQPQNAHESSRAAQPTNTNPSTNQCFKCDGKGYIENASNQPLFYSLSGVQNCFMCMGKGFL